MKIALYFTALFVGTGLSFNAFSWENCGNDANGEPSNCEYEIKDGTLTIRRTDNTKDGAIPDYTRDCSKEHYPVCTSGSPWRWAENAGSVTTLNIESGIKSIGEDAFEDMKFTTATLPDGLVSIGNNAFIECDFLTNINLPSGLQSIGYSAFAGVPLSNVTVPDSVTEVGAFAFRGPTPVHKSYEFEEPFLVDGGPFESKLETITIGADTILNNSTFINGQAYINLDKFTLYCAQGNESCERALQALLNDQKSRGLIDDSKQVSDYLVRYSIKDNHYVLDGKNYRTLQDYANGIEMKRIYTLKEATDAAGKKNSVMIRYK